MHLTTIDDTANSFILNINIQYILRQKLRQLCVEVHKNTISHFYLQ